MKGTFNVNGEKVRIASQRRYVLVRWSDYSSRWVIIKRSDTLSTLAKLRFFRDGQEIIDTATGELR